MTTPRVQISLTLPADAIDELDRQAELVNLSRPQYVQRLLADERQRLQLAETIAYLRENPDRDPEMDAWRNWSADHPTPIHEEEHAPVVASRLPA